ncbi:MAG TPA: DUF3108 domain-containing protein, partial [Casimicrobiaceae bacterium]|nr:DUF3108 domain-containing protein [Casimicrobiaceae bacterium]
ALVSPLSPRPVRKGLLLALAISVLVHIAWTFWPVDTTLAPDETVLTATLTEMPPPPVPHVGPVLPQPSVAAKRPPPRPRVPTLTNPVIDEPAIEAPAATDHAQVTAEPNVASAPATTEASAAPAIEPSSSLPPAVALPPRVELAYKVFLGTQGFLIGDATYRFEHDGDRYRIATVGQARGLAAMIVRGTGKVESRGRITPDGLRPYEFAVERGSADKREVAFFDWDAGTVVLHDGGTAHLEPPTFDPLTILWQPYFSPPGTADQAFGIATTRKVGRYTLKLQAEETIAWRRGDIVTQRWHQVSDDGKMEAWLWLAPSMHYVPIKMRVSRTSRGTLEVLLDSIRADNAEAYGLSSDPARDDETSINAAEAPRTVDDITFNMPDSGMPALPLRDMRGQ